MKKAYKFRNTERNNGIYYRHASPMHRGYFIISRNYRKARKVRNEMAFQSRKRNRA